MDVQIDLCFYGTPSTHLLLLLFSVQKATMQVFETDIAMLWILDAVAIAITVAEPLSQAVLMVWAIKFVVVKYNEVTIAKGRKKKLLQMQFVVKKDEI